jgi:hypothetical protein
MTNPFLFVVGCPRSGTTLLQRMVDAHSEMAIIPEIGWLPSRYEGRQGLTPQGMVTPEFVSGLLREGGLGRYARLPVTRKELENLLEQRQPLSYAELISLLFDAFGKARGKNLVGTKSVDHTSKIQTLHLLWPHARIVHLIRDGRDVYLSAIHWRRAAKLEEGFSTWRDDAVSTAALWWEWQVRLAREAGAGLGSEVYYEMRYESLVSRPAEECAALCAFLGVPYDDAMIRFHEQRGQADSGLDAKHAWLPPKPGLRDWRAQMPEEDVGRFEAAAGTLLDELGYALGTVRPHAERLEHAARIRRRFDGKPLPQAWQTSPATEAD